MDPAIARSIALRLRMVPTICVAWWEKVSILSKVMPSSFGFEVVGMVDPFTLMGRGLFTSFENVVKVVAVDFPGDNWRCLIFEPFC